MHAQLRQHIQTLLAVKPVAIAVTIAITAAAKMASKTLTNVIATLNSNGLRARAIENRL